MKWIKLKDRKPNPHQLCLICAKSADPKKPLRHISFWDDEEQSFCGIVPYWRKFITHWAPYPKTPFTK